MSGPVSGAFTAAGFTLPQDLRKQVVALDEQFRSMEKQIATLKADNLKLKAANEPLQREINGLKKKLEIKGGLSLTETESHILSYMAHEGKGVFAGEISKDCGLNETRVRHFLQELQERGLVWEKQHYSGGTFFALSSDGMAYAVEQGWV